MTKCTKNYVPGSSSFSGGMILGPMRCAGKTTVMLVDNTKARRIIKKLLKEDRNIESAELGLDGDWSENSTIVYDGEFHNYDAYSGSLWATPTLIVHFTDSPNEAYKCWKARSNLTTK